MFFCIIRLTRWRSYRLIHVLKIILLTPISSTSSCSLQKIYIEICVPLNLRKHVFGQFADIVEMWDWFVMSSDSYYLIVPFSLVQHLHHSDNFGLDQTQRLDSYAADHKNIKWVIVLAIGLRDESVVLGIVDCTE